jgi:hypothetical protein
VNVSTDMLSKVVCVHTSIRPVCSKHAGLLHEKQYLGHRLALAILLASAEDPHGATLARCPALCRGSSFSHSDAWALRDMDLAVQSPCMKKFNVHQRQRKLTYAVVRNNA